VYITQRSAARGILWADAVNGLPDQTVYCPRQVVEGLLHLVFFLAVEELLDHKVGVKEILLREF
jgi:hypothetical protein